MSERSNLISNVEIFKTIGHESRTLLNGITGPVQIIRSLSDEPKLIEPLRMLELSVSRFDKFSFRALLLSDLLKVEKRITTKTFNLVDIYRYIVLDLTDLLDFYSIKVDLQNEDSKIEIVSDSDLLSHCIMILFEHAISLSNEESTITVFFTKNINQVDCTLTCTDNGFLYKSLNSVFSEVGYPSDIDLYLLKLGLEVLNAKMNLSLSSSNQSIVTLELP